MRKIIPINIWLKKAPSAVIVFIILGSGLLAFYDHQDFIRNFKPYYVKSYASLISHRSVGQLNTTDYSVAESIPVLFYHGIINEPDGANVLLENFKDQMFAMKKDGWRTINIKDFYEFMRGEKKLPDKSFLLTFDDGSRNSYYPVDPILRALDYSAVTFIITRYSVGDRSGGRYYLSKNELQEMIKSGRWDVQSHSQSGHDLHLIDGNGVKDHFFSNKLWLEDKQRIETKEEFKSRIYYDFVNSKNNLESELGTKVISFAYPFGDFGRNSINYSEAESIISDTIKSVYPISFYQVGGGNPKMNYPQPYAEHLFIKRVDIGPEWKAKDLLTTLENSRSKYLPYYDNLKKDSGWLKDWGRIDFRDNSIVLGADASSTGSAVFLDGTYLWQDYVLRVVADWGSAKNLSLLARYQNSKEYVACEFNNDSVSIGVTRNGTRTQSAIQKYNLEPSRDLVLAMTTRGDTISCNVNDLEIVSTQQSGIPKNGGIGLKFWNQGKSNAGISIKQLSAISYRTTFVEDFENPRTIEEVGDSIESADTNWWLNSGAILNIYNGIGSTLNGRIGKGSKWQTLYNESNPADTDSGFLPQNIFRLVTRDRWHNFIQQYYFKIRKYNPLNSFNRDRYNGLLLFNRYQDSNNLYYAGLRVDGYAVIEKKINSRYYTMAYKPVYTGLKFDKNSNPNLLPLNGWIGIKTEVRNIDSKRVSIKLYTDLNKTGNWKLVAEAIDDGVSFGGASILSPGHAGIRSDFMDVEFDDYKIEEIK